MIISNKIQGLNFGSNYDLYVNTYLIKVDSKIHEDSKDLKKESYLEKILFLKDLNVA